jgi:hypothetical protein
MVLLVMDIFVVGVFMVVFVVVVGTSESRSFFQGGKVCGTSVLDFGSVNGDTLVDDGHVLVSRVAEETEDGTLVDAVAGGNVGVLFQMGLLSVGYFGCVDGVSLGVDESPVFVVVVGGAVDSVMGVASGDVGIFLQVVLLGVGHFGEVDGVSLGIDISPVVGIAVVWSSSSGLFVVDVLWQIGSGDVESGLGVGGILDMLDVAVTVDVRVFAVNDSVGGTYFLLLRVGIGIAVFVVSVAIVSLELRRDGVVASRAGRGQEKCSYDLREKRENVKENVSQPKRTCR